MLNLEAAFRYWELGYQVIPIAAGTKRPLVEWKRFQQDRVRESDINQWWDSNQQEAGIAIITGKTSNVFVIDVDKPDNPWPENPEQKASLMGAAIQKTGGGGKQFFFQWCPELDGIKTTKAKIAHRVDVRGEGGYVIVPPSVHPCGQPYEWLEELMNPSELPVPPDWFVDHLRMSISPDTIDGDRSAYAEILSGVDEGSRNESAARLCGYYLANGMARDVVDVLMQDWNRKNPKPLTDRELGRVIDSIATRELMKRGHLPSVSRDDMSPEQRDERIQAIGEKFEVSMNRIEFIGGENPFYKFYIGQRVAEVDAQDMFTFAGWGRRITSVAQKVPKALNKDKDKTRVEAWHHWANMMMESAVEVETDDQATNIGQMAQMIVDYLIKYPPVSNEQQKTLEAPCTKAGKILINPKGFIRWVTSVSTHRVGHIRLAQRLAEMGVKRVQLRLKASSGHSKRMYMYSIPKEYWPDGEGDTTSDDNDSDDG